MTYLRSVLFDSGSISCQLATLEAAEPGWSPPYRVQGPRLLLPLSQRFECRLGADAFVCDPAAALWLSPDGPYQLKHPMAGQRSVVVTLAEDLGPAGRVYLPLGSQVLLRRCLQAHAMQAIDALEVQEHLAGLVQSVRPADRPAPEKVHRAVERARDYIAAAPERSDTLDEIAKAVHCSAFHLARRFRMHTGTSLHGLRNQLRMTLALDRLREGERSISALAADLGFASHAHFTVAFRRAFGMAPSQMRTNLEARRLH